MALLEGRGTNSYLTQTQSRLTACFAVVFISSFAFG